MIKLKKKSRKDEFLISYKNGFFSAHFIIYRVVPGTGTMGGVTINIMIGIGNKRKMMKIWGLFP